MKIEFFHDVVCGWCYIQSPALRKLQENYNVEIVHRCFILQRNDREMINRWGSLEGAKHQILQHWESCAEFEGSYERFNISGMREAPFNYPNGFLAGKATKTAEILRGQNAHWDMFDLLQKYHLQFAKNIAEKSVILEAAAELQYEISEFSDVLESEEVVSKITKDSQIAFQYGVRSIPTLVVGEKHAIRTTTKYDDLVSSLKEQAVI